MAEITYLQAIRDALWEEMERDEDVFLVGEDIGVYGGAFKVTQGFIEHFGPKRVLDTPMAETAIAGAAIGTGLMGMRPVAEMQFADFISCAFDLLVNVQMPVTSEQSKGRVVIVEPCCEAWQAPFFPVPIDRNQKPGSVELQRRQPVLQDVSGSLLRLHRPCVKRYGRSC